MKLAPLKVGADAISRAVDQRLTQVAAVLRPDLRVEASEPGYVAARWLPELLSAVEPRPGPRGWLLLTALTGAFASAPDVEWLARRLELDPIDEVTFDLLDRVRRGVDGAAPDLEADIVTDAVVVDVTRTVAGGDDRVNGVVAECLDRWRVQHPVLEVTREPETAAFLSNDPPQAGGAPRRLVIPWQTTVLVVEPPDVSAELQVPSVAQYSGSRVGVIGYELGPVLASRGHTMGPARRFARYLAEVKHADVIAAIDDVGAREFRGFVTMLGAQGLAGPRVETVDADDVAASVWSLLVGREVVA